MQPVKEYTFRISLEEAGIIGQALSEMPYRTVVGLIAKLQVQISEQENANRESPTPPATSNA